MAGQDNAQDIVARAQALIDEVQGQLAAADEFDHIVVNDDFSTAVDQLVELLGL